MTEFTVQRVALHGMQYTRDDQHTLTADALFNVLSSYYTRLPSSSAARNASPGTV